eukprot:1991884-Prymnesium_polylepis.1
MTVVLTAMNRFINEADGSQTAFLDGNQPDRLCAPVVAHVEARGGAVRTGGEARRLWRVLRARTRVRRSERERRGRGCGGRACSEQRLQRSWRDRRPSFPLCGAGGAPTLLCVLRGAAQRPSPPSKRRTMAPSRRCGLLTAARSWRTRT